MDGYLAECEKPILKALYGYGTFKTKGYTDRGEPIVWRSESHNCKRCGEMIMPTKQRVAMMRRNQLITRVALGYVNVHPRCDKRKVRKWKEIYAA